MADIEGDGAPLNLSSFESPVFTGREEDLIISGDSLFSFSGGSGLGVGENCASFQGSPSLLSPPASFQPTASLPPTTASNAAATAGSRAPKSPGAGNDGQDDSSGDENRGEAEADKKKRFPASSLLQLLEAAVAAGDSESIAGSRPGSDPLQEKDIRAVGAPVERDKKRSCSTGDGVSSGAVDASGMVADNAESMGGRDLVDGALADNSAGNPDAPAPSPAGVAPQHSSRTETGEVDPEVPSEPNMTAGKLSSMDGAQTPRLDEGRRIRRPADHVDSTSGVVRPESTSILDRGAAVEESHSRSTGGEGKDSDAALVPTLSTTALGDGMVGGLELIPGFDETVDSHFMNSLLQSSDTQPHAVDDASRQQSHKEGTEEGQAKQAEPSAPIAVGELEKANEMSGITGCPVTSDPDVLKGGIQTQAFEQPSVIPAPQPPPSRVPPPSPQEPSSKSLEPEPPAMQRSASPTPVPTQPVAQVPSVLSPTPSTSDPGGEPSERPAASRDSANPEESLVSQGIPKASGPMQSAAASGDCVTPSVDVGMSGGDGGGGCSFPSQATSIGRQSIDSAGNLTLVRAADGKTGDRGQSSQALEAQASSGISAKERVDVEGGSESRESVEIHVERPPLPRKAALRFTPRDHATHEKVAQFGYNPAQQLIAPLHKPIDAVFKFLLKKWTAVSYGDLNNIRIVYDGGVGPLLQHVADSNRGGADAGTSEPGSGLPATAVRDAYVWGPPRSTESLIDLVESLPEATRDLVCKNQVLYLTYTFVPGPLGPRQPLLPNRHMGNMLPPAGGSSVAAPGDGALTIPAETTASTPDHPIVVDVTAVPEGRSKLPVTDVRSPAGNAAADGRMIGQSSRPKRLMSRASPRPATGQQPPVAKSSRGGRRARSSREMTSMGPRNKPGDGHVPGLSRPAVGCERAHGGEAHAKPGSRATKESHPLQAASPSPSGFLAQMHTAAVASGIESQVETSVENPAAPPAAPSGDPNSNSLAYPSVTSAVSGPGNATSVVSSMLPPKDASLPAEDPMVELEQIINQGNLDDSSRIGEVDVAGDNALMGEETCMALFGGSDARVELLVDPASRRVEGDVPRNEGPVSPSDPAASVDPAAADGRSPVLPSSASFSTQPSALTTMSREARRDRTNGSNTGGSDIATADIASGPASCAVHTSTVVQERTLAFHNTTRPRPGAATVPSAREPQQPSAVPQANPTERRGSSSSEAPAAASRDARSASDGKNLKTSNMKPPPPVPLAQLPALQARREPATEVTARRNSGAVALGGMKGQSQPLILSPVRDAVRSSAPSLEKPRMEPAQNGGGEPAMMGNTGGAESQGKGKPREDVMKLPEGGRSGVDSPGVVTHTVSKERSAIGGVTKRRRADGDALERPNKKECIPGVMRSPRQQQVGQNSSICSARDVESGTPGTPKVAAALKARPFAFAAAKNAERSQGVSVTGNDGGLEVGRAGTNEVEGVCESPILSPSAVVASLRAHTPLQSSPRTSERHSVLPSPLCSFSPLWPATTASIDLSDIPTPTMMKEIQAGDGDAMACFPGLLWNMSNSGCDEEAESPKCEGPITRWLGLAESGDPGVGGSPERDTTLAASGERGPTSQPGAPVPPTVTAVAPEEEGSKTLPTLIRLGRSMTKGLSLLPNPSEPSAVGKDGPKPPPGTAPAGGKDDRSGAEAQKDVGKHTGSGEREGENITVAGVSCGRREGGAAQSKAQAPASSTTSSSRSGSKGAVESKPKKRAKKHRITPTLVSNVLPSTSAGLADTTKMGRAAVPSLTPGGAGSGMRIVNDRDSEESKA